MIPFCRNPLACLRWLNFSGIPSAQNTHRLKSFVDMHAPTTYVMKQLKNHMDQNKIPTQPLLITVSSTADTLDIATVEIRKPT